MNDTNHQDPTKILLFDNTFNYCHLTYFFQFSFKNEILWLEKIEKLLPIGKKLNLQLSFNNDIIKLFEFFFKQ